MKPFITLIILLTVAVGTHAQPIYKLKAVAIDDYKSGSFRQFDSAAFYYSGNNAGDAGWGWAEQINPWAYNLYGLHTALRCDSTRGYYFYFDSAYIGHRYQQEYHTNGKIKTYTKKTWDKFNSVWEKEKEHFVYNGNNQLAEWYVGENKYLYRYDGNGRPDSLLRYRFYMQIPGWALQEYTTYSYNTGGQLQEKGEAYTIYSYSYDANGRIVTEKITSTQSSPDTMVTDYTYDASGALLTKLIKQWHNPSNAVINKERWNYTYDAAGMIQGRIIEEWNIDSNKWENYSKATFTSNSFGLPETFDLQLWEKGAWIYDYDDVVPDRSCYRMRFYYELAWPVSVNAIEGSKNISIYPVPARNSITIAAGWQQAQAFTAVIYDMQGRVQRQWREQPVRTYKRTIPLEDIPAGQYVLKLLGEKEQAVQQFSILK